MSNELTPVTIKLEEPVTANGKTYSEITINRKMKGKDLVAADAVRGDVLKGHAICASMTGVPLSVFSEMNIDDLAAVNEALIPFMGKYTKASMEKQKDESQADLST